MKLIHYIDSLDTKWNIMEAQVALSPLLAIPMLQIVFKHLNISLFARFLRGVPFLRSLLALTVIWSERITALLMAWDPDKYTHIHRITVFKYSCKNNLLCLKWTFGEMLGKNIGCDIILDPCSTVGLIYRPSVSMLI